MAAQASMLRYDMRTTTSLADGLYKPERAIEVASAFQRLGLAVGDLGDPFKLMNDSIMDPQGLQDSLIKVSEKFTYFDDKTKTFKISPEGVLHLKELEAQTGVSAKEMTKLGLASAEVNRRISQIKSFNLNIDEKDTQLLANLSRINDKGKLEVYVKDENGERSYKELTDIGREQLMATLKEQKEQKEKPEMTLEEMARSQLTVTEKLEADVAAIYKGLLYGFGKTTTISDIVEATTRSLNVIGGTLSSNLSKVDGSNKVTRNIIQDFKEFFKDIKTGKSGQDSTGDLFIKLGKEIENANNDVGDKLKKSLIEIYGRLGEQTYGEETLKRGLGSFLKGLGISSKDNSSNIEKKTENKGTRNLNPPQVTPTNKGGGVPAPTKIKNTPTPTPKFTPKKEDDTTKFEQFSKSIETTFIRNLENIKKNQGVDQSKITPVEENLKKDITSLVEAFKSDKNVNFSELFEKIKKENVNSPEYIKESLRKSYEEFSKTLKENNNRTGVETKFLEQYEEFIKKNNGGIVSNTNNTNNKTNKYIRGSDNQQQRNDSKSTLFSDYDALLFGTKNISGKPEVNKDVANNFSKGATPVALGGKDKKDDNTIYQKIDQNIKIDYAFSPIEVKISGENGKLDATKVQAMINTSLNDALSKFSKDMIKSLKDDNSKPVIAGAPNYRQNYTKET
jgi:ribosomal protein L11